MARRAARPAAVHVDGVLIVGGGYAGVHAARAVRRSGRRAVIVDPTGRHDFVTRLAAVAGGTGSVDDASASLADFASEVIVGSMASAVDGEVTLADGRALHADAVVITAGAVSTTPPVPGIELALPLRTAEDALELRERIAASETVVIIGGGATGVQLAGAIGACQPSIRVVLVDQAHTLLSTMSEATGHDAARILDDRGVEVRLAATVDRIEVDGVIVDGQRIDGLPVWAAGFTARGGSFGFPVDDAGRVLVDDHLLIDGCARTFAAGDIAAHRSADGAPLAMSAQIAVQSGEAAGRNAVRLLRGDVLVRPRLRHRGWVLDLGGGRGLAEFGPVGLTAPFFDLLPPFLHSVIDAKHLLEIRSGSILP